MYVYKYSVHTITNTNRFNADAFQHLLVSNQKINFGSVQE